MTVSKNLKTVILSLALVVATQMSFAQRNSDDRPDRMPPKERVEQMLNDFAAKANLTETQKTEMKALHKAHFEEVKAKRKTHRAEMDALRDDFEAKLGKILSDEQMTTLKDMKADRKNKRKGAKKGRKGKKRF